MRRKMPCMMNGKPENKEDTMSHDVEQTMRDLDALNKGFSAIFAPMNAALDRTMPKEGKMSMEDDFDKRAAQGREPIEVRKHGWDDRDIPLDDAVCEITWQDGSPWVRLCFHLDGQSYEIEQDKLPDIIRDTFRALA